MQRAGLNLVQASSLHIHSRNFFPFQTANEEKSGLWDCQFAMLWSNQKRKGAGTMDYSIVWVRGHVEVYDWAGRFCFSADSEREAQEELALTA